MKVNVVTKKDGSIIAIIPADLRAEGEDAPSQIKPVLDVGQAMNLVELDDALAKETIPDLGRLRIVDGKLVIERPQSAS